MRLIVLPFQNSHPVNLRVSNIDSRHPLVLVRVAPALLLHLLPLPPPLDLRLETLLYWSPRALAAGRFAG